MKCLMAFLLLMFTIPAFAGDSGSYFNPERDGEGIQLTRNGDRIQFFFYTYKDWQGCPGIVIPETGLVTEENCHYNRWFYTDANPLSGSDSAEGWLYMGLGVNYPDCVVNEVNPFQDICGVATIVGRFLMERSDNGWRFVVIPFGDVLDIEDSLYNTVFDMSALLFEATD